MYMRAMWLIRDTVYMTALIDLGEIGVESTYAGTMVHLLKSFESGQDDGQGYSKGYLYL